MQTKKTLKYPVFIAGLVTIFILAACNATVPQTAASVPNTAIPATLVPLNTNTAVPSETVPPTEEPTAAIVATQAPTDTLEAVASGSISFAGQVLPIFNESCFNCHGGNKTENDLALGSYAGVMAGSEDGAVLVPGDPAASVLVELIANQKMPKRGAKLTQEQVQLVSDWITQGALDN
ncbi:MAG: hypothetical protein CVU39_14850 [Chloroflexi bacterium HGW-Chloroflexi-10]|nr:MAG: hypothetical protein CVU39_14850 [Chloroflexi bacterium HGW-Chloroflexi-10]